MSPGGEVAGGFPPRPTALLHLLLAGRVGPGDLVVDATAGNGHDTEFLARLVGPEGRVLAFDIQTAALESAAARVRVAGLSGCVTFHACTHGRMAEFAVPASVSAVVFNLGYLPGQNHDQTTTAESTLTALDAASTLLRPGGVLAVICYPGHPEGARESTAVDEWFSRLPSTGWSIARYGAVGTRKPPPHLWLGRGPG